MTRLFERDHQYMYYPQFFLCLALPVSPRIIAVGEIITFFPSSMCSACIISILLC